MKALIVDNEQNIRESLKELINAFCPDIKTLKTTDSVKNALETLNNFQPDILFLDVELDDGTGMDLLRQIDNITFQVIFVTAHQHYAIDAFRFSAIDFLLKPVDPALLIKSVEKAKQFHNLHSFKTQLSALETYLDTKDHNTRKLVLKDSTAIYFVTVKDILFCQAEGTYTNFHQQNGQKIIISKTMKEYETLLEPHGFLRVHHSYLVNPMHITRFDKTNNVLIMNDGAEIPVAQRRRDAVLERLSAM